MNITTQPVSFLPTSAAQPTDVLRRDNAQREIVTPLKANQAFHRERGLGNDTDRRPPGQERSYAQQLAQARVAAGFPYFIKQVERQAEPQARADQSDAGARSASAEQPNELQQALQRSRVQRDDEPAALRYESFTQSPVEWSTLSSYSMDPQGGAIDPVYLERGERIEQYYQGSFRPVEHFLLGIA